MKATISEQGYLELRPESTTEAFAAKSWYEKNKGRQGEESDVIILKCEEKYATCDEPKSCLLYTSPSPRDRQRSRMPSSA